MKKLSVVVFGLLLSSFLYAQTPTTVPAVDGEAFPGSQICTDVEFQNSGSPGYGPYLRLSVPAGLSYSGSTLFGLNVPTTSVGVFPPAPGNQLTDPVTGDVITGNPGDSFYIIQPQIGSVVSGGPPLVFSVCLDIDPTATVNVPLPVTVTPVYEFGDTPTGDNGPIVGTDDNFNITPVLVTFDKSNDTPENERPPGPSWPLTYTLNVDVADNNTIDNVVVNDVLPASFVLDTGSINISGGNGCTSNLPHINVSCNSVTGTAGSNELVITYSGYFSDVLDETTCQKDTAINNATLDADFNATAIPQLSDSNTIEIEHMSIQKSASPGQVVPGNTVTYNLNVQLSDYGNASDVVITDVLPDGVTFNSVLSGGVTPTVLTDTPALGETTLIFDVTAALGQINAGTGLNLSYDATVNQTYANSDSVLASDPLNNSVTMDYDLVEGASACNDGSAAAVVVAPVVIAKEVVSTGPYVPGDTVTYRLSLTVPSGDTNGVVFEDFFPLPVFDATTVDTTLPLTSNSDISLDPSDTLGLTPSSITTDGATNSLTINWPNITTTSTQTLSVLVDIDVTDDPFPDNLSLANLLLVSTENTQAQVSTGINPVLINVRAPVLQITKGVTAALQGSISPNPSILPVNGNVTDVDAGDSIDFVITVENIGGAPAYDVVVTDPGAAGLTGCTVSAVTDGNGNVLAYSGSIGTGITLTSPLAANDGTLGAPYADDTALVTVSCTIDGSVETGSSFINTATADYASLSGAVNYPQISDDATVTVADPSVDKSIVSITPNVDGNNGTITIGEVIQYQVEVTLPEGVASDAVLTDQLDNGLTFLSFDSITPSSGDVTTSVGGGFAGVLSGATGLGTRNATFNFGQLTNSNSDNNTAETITIVYSVLVNDVLPANQNGRNKNNSATFTSDSSSDSDSAPNLTIREPVLGLNKSVLPANADAGDTVTYTVVMSNTGTSPAFDVVITDPLSDPDLTLVAGTVTTSSGTVTTGNGGGDTTVQVDVASVPVSGTVTVTFNVDIDPLAVSGSVLNNIASTIGDSLPGNDPNERDYGPVTDDADVTIAPAQVVKSVLPATSTEQSEGVSGQGDPSLVDLTLGEQVTFNIVATLAEGVSPSVIITDTLPDNATGQMEVTGSEVISVGGNLTPANIWNPGDPGVISGANNNVVTFDFGSVTNTPDGTVNADDQIVVQVTGVVTNAAVNTGIEVLTNNVLIQYDTGLNVSGSADVEVVEPVLNVNKSGSVNSADAGDTITYTITIDNTAPPSSARAFEATLSDTIPADLSFAGNLQVVSGLAPDTGPTESGGTITASWNNFPIGQSVTISYDVTVDTTVTPEQVITNTANIAWTSMPGANANERTGTDAESHAVTITASGLSKTVLSTSEPSTGNSQNGPEPDLTIGEQVTYRMTLTLPESTTNNAVMTDQLPNTTAKFDLISSQIISIGSNLTVPGAVVGDAGVATDTNADTYLDLITWNLGNVVNAPDGLNNSDDEIVFEVVAVIVDDPVNQTNLNDIVNTATFSTDSSSVMDTALVDIVEPIVAVSKTTIPASITADAGDVLQYQLTISHEGNSSADAFNLIVQDNLPVPGTEWINDGTASSTCPGFAVDSSAEPMIEFTFSPLDLTTGSCTITYDVQVNNLVNPTVTYPNTANLSYTSTPVIVAGQTRTSTDSDQTSFVTPDPAVVKVTAGSSLGDTGDNQGNPLVPDLAIGEEIDFTLTIIVPEGVTTNAVVTDQLPTGPGYLEMVSATVDTIGGSITNTSLPGTPVITDSNADTLNDRVVFDFGDITNQPDGVVDAGDQITMTVTARLVDNPGNMAIDTLTNNVTFTYGTGGPQTDSADVEVVEPNLGLAKSFGTVNDYVVPITLTMNNTGGSASAYDLVVEDVFDTNIWDASGFSQVTIPVGFVMTTVAGPGPNDITVRISSDGNFTPPDSSLEPNEVVNFTFNATLRSDVPIPTTLPNTATITEASSLPGNDPDERVYGPVNANDTLLLPALDSDKTVVLDADSNSSGGASPGETLNYTITVVNSGDAPATSVVVTDIPDPNGSLVVGSVTTDVGTVTTGNTGGDTTVAVNVGTLNNGATVTISYQVLINNPLPVGVTELVNQALITSQEVPDFDSDDPSTPPNDDPTVISVDAAPDMVIVKDDGGTTTAPGGTVIYTLGYSNNGTQDATGVEITETVPANSTFDAGNSSGGWSCAPNNNAGSTCTLAVGAVAVSDPVVTVNFAVTVDDPIASGVTELNNTALIADDGTNGADLTPGDNSDSDNTPITASPDLQVSKDDGGVTVQPGDVITYTINYANVGNQDATGVVITEAVPTNSTFVPGSSSGSWVCVPDNNAGSTCTVSLATLAAGDIGSLTFAVQVDNPLAAGVTAINNAVSINDDGNNGPDPTPGDNNDTDNTPVNAAPDLTLVKDDGVVLASPGASLVYALSYANVGNQNATGVVITDTVPIHTTFDAGNSTAGWSCINGAPAGSVCSLAIGAVAGGGSGAVNFAVNVDNPLAPGATSVVNTASVADDGTNGADPTPGNNSDSDTDSLTGTALDLAVTKDDGGVTVTPGDVVTYVINYDNLGNIGATGVELNETVPIHSTFNAGGSTPGWTCVPNGNAGSSCTYAVGTLNGGDSGSVNFAVTVNNPLVDGVTQLNNSVSITDDGNNGPDIDTSNNGDSDNTPVDAAPDLTVSKVDQQASVNAGDVLIYDISYENIGDQDATGVVITEIVPLHTTFSVSGSSAGWVCSPNGNAGSSCTLAIGPVNAGDPAQTVQFAVLVDDALPSGIDTLNNTVSINDDGNNGDDTDPTNNDDSEPTDVVAAPDLAITKTDGGLNSGPGQTIVYTLNYENIGSQDTVGVVITETIPANTTFNAGASNPAWSCSGTTPGNSCTYFVGNLNVGDTGSVVFAVNVDDPLPQNVQQILNSVNIGDDGSNGPDEDLSNNDDDETTGLFLNPPVGVKTVEVDASDPRLLHWTFYWYNPNNNVDLPVFIYDEIPAGTTYVPTAGCTPDGTSTCTTPVYNSGLNRIELTAVISPDPGAPANETMANLANEVVIRFDTRITIGGSVTIENQAMAHWDENNNGDPFDDEQGGQQPVLTDDPTTTDINDPTGVRTALPVPTLSTWALLLLALMSIWFAVPVLRRRGYL